MTKTYNDIEAVTRLLEEKERDLELAARIGQTLLSKNKDLSTHNETLEEQLSFATDKVNQLLHDISLKDELLKIYNEDAELEDTTPTPTDDKGLALPNVDFLQKKVDTLEDENINLRLESAQLKSDTDTLEEKEKKLVEDCIQQISELNKQVDSLAEELHLKSEENGHQKEEITGFLSQITDLQKKIRKLTLENMDLHEKFSASTESQRNLTREVSSMQDKYDELFEMLEEAHEEVRILRGRQKVRASGRHHHSACSAPADSLASELEASLQRELSQENQRAQSWKIFETAKAAKRAAAKSAEKVASSSVRMSVMASPFRANRDSDSASQLSQGPSTYLSDGESFASDGYSGDMDSLYGSNPELGRPGVPGSNDLESALKRLAIRRANEFNERDFQEEEDQRKKQQLLSTRSGTASPYIPSPGSSISCHSSASGGPGSLSGSGQGYKMSDKLQIVKPMEGSMTLRHWQHLATPHLGGIFEPREGVQMKGEKKLDIVEEVYSLSDFEEDDPRDVHTRKGHDSGMIYTFTNSTVHNMGPGPYRGLGSFFDNSQVSSCQSPLNLSLSMDESPMQSSTPKPVYSVHQETSSHQKESLSSLASVQTVSSSQGPPSMSLGLAALLQGRENTGFGRAILRGTTVGKKAAARTTTTATSLSSELKHAPDSAVSSCDTLTVPGHQGFWASQSLGSLSSAAATRSKDLPGSRSFDQGLREGNQDKLRITVDNVEDESTKMKALFQPGMTGQGFLHQLKSKGYSLYGLWGGSSGKGEDPPEDKTVVGEGVSDVDSSIVPPMEGDSPTTKSSVSTVFPSGPGGAAGGGVLGALTNFRSNGGIF